MSNVIVHYTNQKSTEQLSSELNKMLSKFYKETVYSKEQQSSEKEKTDKEII